MPQLVAWPWRIGLSVAGEAPASPPPTPEPRDPSEARTCLPMLFSQRITPDHHHISERSAETILMGCRAAMGHSRSSPHRAQCPSINLLSLGPGTRAPWREQDLGLELLVPPFTSQTPSPVGDLFVGADLHNSGCSSQRYLLKARAPCGYSGSLCLWTFTGMVVAQQGAVPAPLESGSRPATALSLRMGPEESRLDAPQVVLPGLSPGSRL